MFINKMLKILDRCNFGILGFRQKLRFIVLQSEQLSFASLFLDKSISCQEIYVMLELLIHEERLLNL